MGIERRRGDILVAQHPLEEQQIDAVLQMEGRRGVCCGDPLSPPLITDLWRISLEVRVPAGTLDALLARAGRPGVGYAMMLRCLPPRLGWTKG